MSDKSVCDATTDHLPEPLRSLAKCGKVFGVAVDKRPVLPRRWKEDEHLLKTYSEAVAATDEMIADGKNAVVYMVMTKTPYRLLDFDPDKTTGELKPDQLKAIDYYDKRGVPIMESSSKVGRHLVVEDKDRQLPHVGSEEVKKGNIPFEVKKDLIFLSRNIVKSRPILPVDENTVRRVNDVKPTKAKPRKHFTDKIKRIRKTKKALTELREAIQWCYDNNITDVITDNATFSCFAIGSKQTGLPIDEQETFCLSQQGDTRDVGTRLSTTNDQPDDQRASLMSLFTKRGYKTKNVEPPDDDKLRLYPSDGQPQNILKALKRLNFKFRVHELKGEQVMFPDSDQWQDVDDDTFFSINVDWLANTDKVVAWSRRSGDIAFQTPVTIRREVLATIFKNAPKYNPIREWIEDNIEPMECWEAIDHLIDCYKIDAEDRLADAGYTEGQIREYYRHLFVLMLYGVTVRALKPGADYDRMVIMVGDQGCGKGLGLKLILPPKEITDKSYVIPNDAYGARCQLTGNRADWYKIRQYVLAEIEELSGMNKIDLERLKACLSDTQDNFEQKYKNKTLPQNKTYAPVGTSNDPHCIASDDSGARRFYIGDFGYGFGDAKGAQRELPIRLTDEWRRAAFGHILWMIDNGYRPGQWSDDVELMRQHMCGSSQRTYAQVEAALSRIARIITSVYKTEQEHDRLRHIDIPNGENIMKHGLPIRGRSLPSSGASWERLLLTLYPQLERHRNRVKVSCKHLGWTIIDDRKRAHGYPRCRGWAIPVNLTDPVLPDKVDKPEVIQSPTNPQSVSTYSTDTPSDTTSQIDEIHRRADEIRKNPLVKGFRLPRMTTQAEDDAKERKSRRELDDVYLDQKSSADDNLVKPSAPTDGDDDDADGGGDGDS